MGERSWQSSRCTGFLCLTSLITRAPNWLADELQSYSNGYQVPSFLWKRCVLTFLAWYTIHVVHFTTVQRGNEFKTERGTSQHSKCIWIPLPRITVTPNILLAIRYFSNLKVSDAGNSGEGVWNWCSCCSLQTLNLSDHHGDPFLHPLLLALWELVATPFGWKFMDKWTICFTISKTRGFFFYFKW